MPSALHPFAHLLFTHSAAPLNRDGFDLDLSSCQEKSRKKKKKKQKISLFIRGKIMRGSDKIKKIAVIAFGQRYCTAS